jgi:hypothetical protein
MQTRPFRALFPQFFIPSLHNLHPYQRRIHYSTTMHKELPYKITKTAFKKK